MEPAVIVAIVSTIIAFIAFAFAIYKHFGTRKIARIVYEISQISDYDVPESFLEDMTTAPIAMLVESRGNKRAENIVLRLKTRTKIDKYTIVPKYIAEVDNTDFTISVPSLNPTQTFKVFLHCKGNPAVNQIQSIELTHSEGVGLNKRSSAYTKLNFRFFFMEFEYDLNTRTLKILRAGPWHLR